MALGSNEMASAEVPLDILRATAHDVQQLLTSQTATSWDVVQLYLKQIEAHNHDGLHLNAVISLAPIEQLHARAVELDQERSQGHVRGPLHGIPILVKDNIMTEASLGMDTTCGSYALKGAKVKANADVIDFILKAGMIILGKANLSEWAGKKGYFLPGGWSAIGGQTQSPYVRGGFIKGDKFLGHSNPCGSSSGCAAGVAAGFSPLALGTETDGSITQPCGRASLYGLKLTVGSVSTKGTSPYSPLTDSLGPMAKCAMDVATLTGVLMQQDFTGFVTESWETQRVAFVDPEKWELGEVAAVRNPELLREQRAKMVAAADLVEKSGAKVVRNVEIPQLKDLEIDGRDAIENIWDHDFKAGMADFLAGYEGSAVKSVEDIVEFNTKHADLELPEEFPNGQTQLTDALAEQMSDEQYDIQKAFIREKAGPQGLDKVFVEHEVDVIAGPLDGRIVTIAAAAGYPCGVVPLGYADNFNGRAYGMTVVAPAGGEDRIIKFMSAWEASNPNLRKPPPQLEDWNSQL